jgi:broad specificity phosphatase PhoE
LRGGALRVGRHDGRCDPIMCATSLHCAGVRSRRGQDAAAMIERITLVRHGETTGQSSVRYYGSTDVPLSALGERQMRRAGAALAAESFDALLSSRLRRSRDGAALVAGPRLVPHPIAGFDEVDFGRWEGWTREEIAARDAMHFERWQRDPESFVYPGGECRQAFHRRVAGEIAALFAQPPGRDLLIVVHRGVIAVVLSELLRLSSDARRGLAIDLGSIHVVRRGSSGWHAEYLNRLDHLSTAPDRTQVFA